MRLYVYIDWVYGMSKKRSGIGIFLSSKATIIGIIIIIFMAFMAKSTVPSDNKILPKQIFFSGYEYYYEETIKASPFYFIKAKEGSKEGYRILVMWRDKKASIPKQVYIYIGRKKYLKYIKK
jgi:hypothetical protein